MQPGRYVYRTEFARRYFGEGLAEGRLEGARAVVLALVDRHGEVAAALRDRVEACGDADELCVLATASSAAPDRLAIERLLAARPAGDQKPVYDAPRVPPRYVSMAPPTIRGSPRSGFMLKK